MASIEDSLESQHYNRIQAFMQYNDESRLLPANTYLRPANNSQYLATPSKPSTLHGTRQAQVASTSAPDMGGLMAEQPPRQHPDLMRAKSFAGFDNAASFAGDTQPIPSQVYRDYQIFNNVQERSELGPAEVAIGGREDHEAATQIDVTPARAGMVDFGNLWKSQTQHTVVDNVPLVDIHSIHESVEDDVSPGIPSSLHRDHYLKTPAIAGFKRNRNGDTISPTTASKTPGSALSDIFGNMPAKRLMTATQIFDNTQAMTSPAADLTRSDPVETRPSPNFQHAQPASPSVHGLSSPTKVGLERLSRGMAGPRDYYNPMNESQKRREAALLQQKEQPIPVSSKVTFDDDSQISTPGKHTAMASQNKGHAFSDARVKRSGFARSYSDVLPSTRAARLTKSPEALTGSASEEVIEVPDDDDASSVGDESAYEYDEFGETVVPSQRRSQSQNQIDDEDMVVSDREDADMEVAGSPEPEPEPGARGARDHSPTKANDAIPARVDSSQNTSSANPAYAVIANSQSASMQDNNTGPPRPIEPSSLSSYVPGSQLPLASSQWRPLLEGPLDISKFSSLPQPPVSSSPVPAEGEEKSPDLPSSPPLLVPRELSDAVAIANVDTEGNDGDRDANYQHHAAQPLVTRCDNAGENIGETSAALRLRSLSPEGNKAAVVGNAQKVAVEKFDSTKTSIFDTAATHISTSQPQSSSRSRRMVSESPRKIGGARRLGDIANDPTPPDSIGEIDISIGMNIMNQDDENFLDAMKSPVKPTRPGKLKTVYRRRAASKMTDGTPVEVSDPVEAVAPAETDARKQVVMVEPKTGGNQQADVASPILPAKKRRKTGRAQGNANTVELPEASALPASHERSDVLVLGPRRENESNRADHKESISVSSDMPTPVETKPDTIARAAEARTESAEQADSSKLAAHNHTRVLAYFKGQFNAYYPATCLSTTGIGSSTKYSVRFDEGTVTTLDCHHVCAFDLRLGDVVKLDLPNLRTHLYTIEGFDPPSELSQETLLPDSHRQSYIQVKVKSGSSIRKPVPTLATSDPAETITVHSSAIKITPTMWPKFSARTYVHPQSAESSRNGTPVQTISIPTTPQSRARRQTFNSGNLPLAIPSPFPSVMTRNVFSNMAFAISYSSSLTSDAARDHTSTQIMSSGGFVLQSGLHELFDVTVCSPTLANAGEPASDQAPLKLKSQYSSLGFVALIADSHSRTQKYVQALALSLPTLHHRWITDSLRASRALPWGPYLLPAGDSSFLGAVRSRSLIPYDPTTSSLTHRVDSREKLLDGSGVLLLGDESALSKSKVKGTDRRDVYAFLSLALGAGKVGFVDNTDIASGLLGRGEAGWKWLHCAKERVGFVAKVLRGEKVSALDGIKGRGKKRKRGEEGEEGMSVVLEGGIRVVGDEFVIQSLILGMLVEG
ncbi:DNA repair protein crb2 [Sphaceloma murrayae]|uniref:DNA repair protein crb2 n=1 Tax=Sphaceloma murrayae TaxID=2082308 RepID=A0A2K1R1D5_9PEZI|nr:DNA repair protein crb2 [Sphaceloma murrayae]